MTRRTFALVAALMAFSAGAVASATSTRSSRQKSQPPSAEALLADAIKTASDTHKAIFVDFGASWCVPCLMLDTFLEAPEIHSVLARQFVFVKIAVLEQEGQKALNTPGGGALMQQLGGRSGIPFFAFLDATGAKVGSDTGYPGDPAGVKSFMEFIDRAAPRLTPGERAAVANYLDEHSYAFGAIAGRVADEEGQPAAGARVSILERVYANGQWMAVAGRQVETDSQGGYQLEGIAPGSYRLVIDGAFVPIFYPPAAEGLTVGRNQTVTNTDIRIARGRIDRVSGSVVDTEGTPISGGSVWLTSVNWPAHTQTTVVLSDGSFALESVSADKYNMWAISAGDTRGAHVSHQVGFAELNTNINSADVAAVQIVARRGVTVTGTIATEGGPLPVADRLALSITAPPVRPLAGAPARVPSTTRNAIDGFELSDVFGRRAIRVSNLPAGWALKSVMLGGRDVTDEAIDFDTGERSVALRIAITDRFGSVAGTVSDRDAKPATAGAVIVFAADARRWSYPSRFVKMVPIQTDGSYVTSGLPAGDYLVVGLESMTANWDAPESLERLRSRSTTVDVTDGQRRTVPLRQAR